MAEARKSHGGKRDGAGRKPRGPKGNPRMLRMTADEERRWTALATTIGKTRNDMIRLAVEQLYERVMATVRNNSETGT